MYKTIFVINIIIYMCLQHIDIYEFKTAVFLSLRERICFPNEIYSLKNVEFAPQRLSWFNWLVSFAPEFLCCYFCESSCLFVS